MSSLLNDLLLLNVSVVGYASVPEILWVAFALATLVVQLIDVRRGLADRATIEAAVTLKLRTRAQVTDALALVDDRILSGRLRVVVQLLLMGLGLYYAVAVPDGYRVEVKVALFALCVVLASTEGLLIFIYWHAAETWRRLNREI